jgi:hypothetical protein
MDQHHVQAALSSEKDHVTHWPKALVGSQSSYGWFGDKNNYGCLPKFFVTSVFIQRKQSFT